MTDGMRRLIAAMEAAREKAGVLMIRSVELLMDMRRMMKRLPKEDEYATLSHKR